MATHFDSDLLTRFRRLALAARRTGEPALVAPQPARHAGGGIEVAGLRDYVAGDDVRYIDWRLCARRDELMSKQFAGFADRQLYLWVDCSQSMSLGSPSKFQVAVEIAALLGCAALWNETRVAPLAFSGRIAAGGPTLCGKTHAPGLLRFLDRLGLDDCPSDLARAARHFCARRQQPAPVVVISDLLSAGGFQEGLDLLRARGYEPRVVQVHEPGEAEPQLLGDLELLDVEGHTAATVTITERSLRRYRAAFREFLESVRGYCLARGLPCVQLRTDLPQTRQYQAVLAPATKKVSGTLS